MQTPLNSAIGALIGGKRDALSMNKGHLSVRASTAVPEPGILTLLGLSMVSIAGLRRWWKD